MKHGITLNEARLTALRADVCQKLGACDFIIAVGIDADKELHQMMVGGGDRKTLVRAYVAVQDQAETLQRALLQDMTEGELERLVLMTKLLTNIETVESEHETVRGKDVA